MHRASRTSGVFALVLLLAGGCGSEGEGGGGQAGSGAPCEEDADCGKGERCNTSLDEPVCGAIRSLSKGDDCVDDLCGSGLECVEDTCIEEHSLGAFCTTDNPCNEGLTCISPVCVEEVQIECIAAEPDGVGPRCDEICEALGMDCQFARLFLDEACEVAGDNATSCEGGLPQGFGSGECICYVDPNG